MVITISNYIGTADTFTFPYNPQSFDDAIAANYQIYNIPYSKHHIMISGGGIAPKTLVLTGHFSGTSKLTNYRDLAKHVMQNYLLKKLYWETDKFYLCIGKQIKQTNTGGRTNFIDYVATFEMPIGILFSNTLKTYTNGGAQETNAGNVTTYIEEIEGVWDGAGDITATDGTNAWKIPASALTAGDTIKVTLIKMVDSGSGIYITEYNYAEIKPAAGSYAQIKTLQTTSGNGLLQLAASSTTASLTIANLNAAYTVKFRDGYSA